MTDGEFNTDFYDQGGQTSSSAALEFCDLAKDASRGVVVYTVTLGNDLPAQDLMAQCATSPETALIATSAAALDEAFEQIVIEARTPILTN